MGSSRCPICGLRMVKEDKSKCPRRGKHRTPRRDATVQGVTHQGGPQTPAKSTNPRGNRLRKEIAQAVYEFATEQMKNGTSSSKTRAMGRSDRDRQDSRRKCPSTEPLMGRSADHLSC